MSAFENCQKLQITNGVKTYWQSEEAGNDGARQFPTQTAPQMGPNEISYPEGSSELWFDQRKRRRKLQVDHQLNTAIQLVEECGIFGRQNLAELRNVFLS